MYKRVFFGPVANDHVALMPDLTWLEKINYSLLGFGVFFVGLYPSAVLNVLHPTITNLLIVSLPKA
jgi:NADH-quinone oxidoreductase subunit M